MNRLFGVIVVALLSIVVGISAHYLSFDRETMSKEIGTVSQITYISAPALGVSYFESASLVDKDSINIAYPEMPRAQKMDFIYEK